MNNTIKIFLLLATVIIIIVLIITGTKTWLDSQKQADTELNETATILSPDIPEKLSEIAEEEYAIEFEADEPAVDIDAQFCDLVKSQCEKQGIKNCEDYKMCMEGVNNN